MGISIIVYAKLSLLILKLNKMHKEEIDDSILFDLVKGASFSGELEPPATSLTLSNPVCGDEVTFFVLENSAGKIEKISYKTKGCFICKATAAALSKLSNQAPKEEVHKLLEKFRHEFVSGDPESSGNLEFQVLFKLRNYPTRTKCVLMPFEALANLLS